MTLRKDQRINSLSKYIRIIAVIILSTGCSGSDAPGSITRFVSIEESHRHLVIFIHGVTGDSGLTWKSNHPDLSMLDLVANDQRLEKIGVDVLSLGYRSTKIKAASSINQVGVRLNQYLLDQGIFDKYDNIVFVGHSQGGLVAKEIVVKHNTPNNSRNLSKIAGLIFLSTPVHGSNLATLVGYLSSNPQFRNMSAGEFNAYLQSLEDRWLALVIARGESKRPRSYSAFEVLPTRGIKIVPQLYQNTFVDLPATPFDRDHIDIAKPNDENDVVYQWLVSRIIDCIASENEMMNNENEVKWQLDEATFDKFRTEFEEQPYEFGNFRYPASTEETKEIQIYFDTEPKNLGRFNLDISYRIENLQIGKPVGKWYLHKLRGQENKPRSIWNWEGVKGPGQEIGEINANVYERIIELLNSQFHVLPTEITKELSNVGYRFQDLKPTVLLTVNRYLGIYESSLRQARRTVSLTKLSARSFQRKFINGNVKVAQQMLTDVESSPARWYELELNDEGVIYRDRFGFSKSLEAFRETYLLDKYEAPSPSITKYQKSIELLAIAEKLKDDEK